MQYFFQSLSFIEFYSFTVLFLMYLLVISLTMRSITKIFNDPTPLVVVMTILWVIMTTVFFFTLPSYWNKVKPFLALASIFFALSSLVLCAQAGYDLVARGKTAIRVLKSILMWVILILLWIFPEVPDFLVWLPVVVGWVSTFFAIHKRIRTPERKNHFFRGFFGGLLSIFLVLVAPIGLSFGIPLLVDNDFPMFDVAHILLDISLVVGWVIGLIIVVVRSKKRQRRYLAE